MQPSHILSDLEAVSLKGLGSDAQGLDVVTQTIHETAGVTLGNPAAMTAIINDRMGINLPANILKLLPTQQQNQQLARMVRRECTDRGFMSAWMLLAEAAPDMGLPLSLVGDVQCAASVYDGLKKGVRIHKSIGLELSLGPCATYDVINRIGPKSVGGSAWKHSEEYREILKDPTWSCPGYANGIPPCVAMGWIGIQRKSTPEQDRSEVVPIQLLGTVDFNLDLLSDNKRGFHSGLVSAARHIPATHTKLQTAALIGLLNYDLQNYIRPIQNLWAASSEGSYNPGPDQVSPKDWASYLVGDCAALVPFAYDENYTQSRLGMANGMIYLQTLDYLFDVGCSNRVSSVAYAAAAGVTQDGVHAAYAVASYEAMAKHFLTSLLTSSDTVPSFGYSACMVAGPWGPFGTRYRAWERCIKYMRQLGKCDHPEARKLLQLASSDLMLRDYDLEKELGTEWARAMKSSADSLIARPFAEYRVPALTSALLDTPRVARPDLCTACEPLFDASVSNNEPEEVRAIAGLPESVTMSRPVGLAVAFRRIASLAYSSDCCDVCSSRIGFWEDEIAYSVLSALMVEEPLAEPSTWMLQHYTVACVTLWPISLPFLLSGFDLLANLSFEPGAMGERDAIDI